tara:strand:- start:1307 stop:1591 length:285 start_codon:yes stop_codon:yes gene_type:complete
MIKFMKNRKVDINGTKGSYVVNIMDFMQLGGPYKKERMVEKCETNTYSEFMEMLRYAPKWRVKPNMVGLTSEEEGEIESALEKASISFEGVGLN